MSDQTNDQLNGRASDAVPPEPPTAGLEHELADELDKLRHQLDALHAAADEHLRVLTHSRPLLTVGAAVALGFVLGRILRRH